MKLLISSLKLKLIYPHLLKSLRDINYQHTTDILIILKNFSNVSAVLPPYYSSLKFDDTVQYSSVQNGILHVTYAPTDYLPSHTVTHLQQHPLRRKTKIFHSSNDPSQPYLMMLHPQWHFSRIEPENKCFAHCFICLLQKKKMIPKNLYS